MLEAGVCGAVTVPLSEVNARLRPILEEFGFAIVSDVFSPEDCAALEGLWAQDLLGIMEELPAATTTTIFKSVQEAPVAAWPLSMVSLGDRFTTQHGLPHGRMAWTIRTHPNVRKPYEAIFGPTERLCVGTDVVFFNNTMKKAEPLVEPHVDQNWWCIKPSEEVYQSVVVYLCGSFRRNERYSPSNYFLKVSPEVKTFNYNN